MAVRPSELRNCVKVEVDVLGSHTHDSTYSLCGRKATSEKEEGGGGKVSELRSCVKVEVDVLSSLYLIVPIVSVEVKQHQKKKKEEARSQRAGAVWKSRWPS